MLLHGLKKARIDQGLSRQELAQRASLSVEAIKRLEQGIGSVGNLNAVMAALDFHFSGVGKGATLSHQILERRKALHLSVRQLAKLASISPNTLTSIESGHGTLAPLMKVLRVLGTGEAKFPRTASSPDGAFLQTSSIVIGDALTTLRGFMSNAFQTCVTSPPYFALRDYGVEGQLGHEPSPEQYIGGLVEVFREVRRVLREDGTLFLVIGDTYRGRNLLGIPWRLALALQEDGWNLRQDIIWSKPNPMPEPVRDRCVRSHEYVFLLSKSQKYHFDPLAIRERGASRKAGSQTTKSTRQTHGSQSGGNTGMNAFKRKVAAEFAEYGMILRNKRSVWEVQVTASKQGHYATFPEALVQTCILAGSRQGDIILDPFAGSGTTGVVAERLGRSCQMIELNPWYARAAAARVDISL